MNQLVFLLTHIDLQPDRDKIRINSCMLNSVVGGYWVSRISADRLNNYDFVNAEMIFNLFLISNYHFTNTDYK